MSNTSGPKPPQAASMPSRPESAWMPEYKPMNVVKRHSLVMHPGDAWHLAHWYEAPREDPSVPEVYTYTDAMSYDPGEEVSFHASTTMATWTLQVYRDGNRPTLVHEATGLPGQFQAMPKGAYRDGCKWPVSHRWKLPDDLASGFYRVVSTCESQSGANFIHHHFFVVRPVDPAPKARFLLILPTSTWIAYNDWGGANSYDGIDGAEANQFSPTLSFERPWTRGLVWLPPGAPRLCDPIKRPAWDAPRYFTKEWAYTNGFAQFFSSAGWAQFDRHFVVWAEREGYQFDMITQTDLHYRPEILSRYGTGVIVGHDEYWTKEMRDTVDSFVEAGGNMARFAGNFLWQVRLEDEGRRQVCYKARAHAEDPVRGTDRKDLLTGAWEDPAIGRPGATTFGVNGLQGIYSSWGAFSPRASGGFTVYRPGHWAFDGTESHYGDVIGAEAGIFAYEVDGLDYTFRKGLPYPTGDDGAPESVEILAMAPAVRVEEEHGGEGFRYYIGNGMKSSTTTAKPAGAGGRGSDTDPQRYGSGMVVSMTHGKGQVFTAGSCEWLTGLAKGDFCTQQITRNVLNRFLGR
jgi:hypothetical protein